MSRAILAEQHGSPEVLCWRAIPSEAAGAHALVEAGEVNGRVLLTV
ncbi:hypothetical protein [Deinococcus sp. YIM 77859]|nr:hypothetical protein [Deinococcus sp. YIM 77859]